MTHLKNRFLGVVTILLALVAFDVRAEQKAEPPKDKEVSAEEADISKIKEKYWARGNEAEVGIVQNRIFSKRRKLELGFDFGTLFGDPFLSTKTLTFSGGYHFNEIYSAHVVFSK